MTTHELARLLLAKPDRPVLLASWDKNDMTTRHPVITPFLIADDNLETFFVTLISPGNEPIRSV